MKVETLKQNKWLRRAGIAVLALFALWIVTWLAVPPIAKSQIQKVASEKLGRKVTVGKIDFKPWSLEATVSDMAVATADGSAAQFSISRIYVDAAIQSIFRLAPVIDNLSIDAPTAHLAHLADGKYDIDDILSRLGAGASPTPSNGEPPKFAVYNIKISGGSVDFDDQTVKRKHALRDFVFNVPFLSNLPSQRDVTVEPKLAFVLNGSKFDSAALTTPFAESRKTDVQLKFDRLDLTPYLGYLPGGLPVAVKAGLLGADLKIDFERAASAGLKISGSVSLDDMKIADAQGRDLLGFASLKVALADVRPLDRNVHLSEVSLAAPDLIVARDAQGGLNLLATKSGASPGDKAEVAASPVAPASAAAGTPPPAASMGWKIQVDKIALSEGKVGWRDATTQPAASIDMAQLGVEVDNVTWPMSKPASFKGGVSLAGAGVKFTGEATDKRADVQTEVEGLPLALAAPYLAQSLVPSLDGKLNGQVDVAWNQPELKLKARKLAVDGLALTQDKTALASVGRFELVDADVDLANHTLAIASFNAVNPKVGIARDEQKRWMFERWLRTPSASGSGDGAEAKVAKPKTSGAEDASGAPSDVAALPKAGSRATDTKVASSKPWALTIGRFAVDNGAVSYSDKSGATPVAFDVTALKVEAQKLAPETSTVSPLHVSGRIAAGRAEAGRFDYAGNVVLKPVSAEGKLEVASVPAHAFKAYYADALNIDIRRAFANFNGNVKFATLPAGISLKMAGDTSLDDFRANSASLTQAAGAPAASDAPRPIALGNRDNQILRWKTLSLRGLQVNLTPAAPLAVDVRETTLTDFFARVIIDPTGRLNLQDLAKKPGQVEASNATPPTTRRSLGGTTTTTNASASRPAARSGGRSVSAEEMVGAASSDASTAAPPVASAASATASPAAANNRDPVINFGPMSLVNGRIDFTDLFVKPNYSADLSELTGKLSAVSSKPQGDKPALADLELHGKAQQTASLDITGKLNPLAKPLELDITAKMRELDLPPLSPYSVRYAGHGIERGKLSMEVNYKIAPTGELTASNKLVLNQLQFGEEVQGAPNSLPVKLAVALLADRNGVIDIDFPISGSLNDPQFSIGPLIFKAVVNLIVKAVTSPFSLLTGGLGGGGGGESSAIVFDPGSPMLNAAAKESLDKVAKALADRPGLSMTVVGTANLDKEREAYQRQRLRVLAQAEKRRAAVRNNEDAADVAPVTDAEYPALLEAVYKRADLSTKPRNIVGLTKSVPVKEMEDLLLPSIPVDEETIRQLAVARGAAVRDYLLAQKLSSERLYLGAVKTQGLPAEWKPDAELNLSTR